MTRVMVGCLVVTLAAIGVVPCHAHAEAVDVTAAPNHCDTAGAPDRPAPAPAADCCLTSGAASVPPAVPMAVGSGAASMSTAMPAVWQHVAPTRHAFRAGSRTASRSAPSHLRPAVLLI